MEKYEKPVMVLEELVDEIHTAVAYPDNNIVMVSGNFGRPDGTQNLVPGNTTNP